MKPVLGCIFLIVAMTLAACGGGGGGSSSVVPGLPSSQPAPALAAARIALVIPTAATAAQRVRKPAFVSPATQSAKIDTGTSSTVVDLSAQSPNCSIQSQGRVCTATANVAFGSQTFTVTTYDQAPVNGAIPSAAHVLGTGTVTQMISANSTAVSIAIDAVVNGFGTLTSFYSWPADGVSRTYGFVLDPVDFGNQPINNHANDPFANPINVTLTETGGSGHAHLQLNGAASGSSAVLHSAADSVSVVYDGGGSPGYSTSIAFAATGVSTLTTTRSPLFVTSAFPGFNNDIVALAGPSSTASFTISEANAPGLSYSATPVNCINIASVTAPALVAGVETFSVTGGTTPSGGGCTIQVSDGMSTVTLGASNAPPGLPTPTPTATPTATPSPTPTPTPTPTPWATPVAPLLPSSIIVNNAQFGPYATFPIAAVAAASPNPYNAAPSTTVSPTLGYSAYFTYDHVHQLIWSGPYAFFANANGSVAPAITLPISVSGGIGVDAAGNVYAGGLSFPNVLIQIVPFNGSAPGTIMSLPINAAGSIAVDAAGYIYVADHASNVYVYAPPGLNAGTISPSPTRTLTGFTNAWSVALDSQGRIYVSDAGYPSPNHVVVFAAGTTNAAQSTPIETISAFPNTVEGIAVDQHDNLWVADLYEIDMFTAASITTNLGGTLTYVSGGQVKGTLTTYNSGNASQMAAW